VRGERGSSPRCFVPHHPLTSYVLLLTLFSLGCHSSPEKKQEKLRQEQKSWEATAQLTDELSQRSAVPDVYRRQVMKKSSENLEKIRRQEQQLSQ
jgi:hypothetical protein